MRKNWVWALGLLALAAGCTVGAYSLRNFAGILVGLALALAALAVLAKPLRGALTTLVSLVVALALAEGAVGLMAKSGDQSTTQYDASSDYVKHYWSQSDIGATPRAGRHTTAKTTAAGESIYKTAYTIGDDGFRVTPAATPPATPAKVALPNPQRVNMLGCSVTFGEGVADDQTMAHHAQQSLPGVTFKNFGIHGYGMHHALAILESSRDTSGALNLVVTAPWHAERSACVPSFSLGSPRYRLTGDGGVTRDGVCGGITYYPLARVLSLSKVYGLVKSVVEAQKGQDPQIELYLGLIQRIAALSKSRQQAVLLAYIRAEDAWFTGSYSNDKVMAKIQAMGIEVVDVTLADKSEKIPAQYTLHALDSHPTSAGHLARVALLTGPVTRALAAK
jgi:hypothetical protein